MKTSALIIAAACVPFLSACNTSQPAPKQAAATPAVEPWVADARAAASSMPPKLLAVLQPAIKERGPAGAIDVCSKEAPKLAKAASEQTGWQIRRVSLKNRNPKAVPDAWERATLESFDKAQAAGVDPAMLERAEVVVENGQYTGEIAFYAYGEHKAAAVRELAAERGYVQREHDDLEWRGRSL